MFFPQKSQSIDQNFIVRKLGQERIEIEELQLKFQDEGDKLLQRVNDFNTSEKDIKINLKKNTQQLMEDHQTHLIELEKKVQLLKNHYIEQIEILQKKIRMLAESQYKVNDNNISTNLYQECNNNQQSTNISKDLNDRESQRQLENATELINSFLPLKETTIIYECQQIVYKIIHNLALLQMNDKKYEIGEQSKINLVCQEHQDQIILVDLISRQIQSTRLGCQTCANLNPQIKYQSIQQVQNQWKKVHQQKMENMQINYVALMNKIIYIQEFFQLIKNKTFKSLEQADITFDTIYYKYTQAILDLNKKMQKPWSSFSKEELETNALQINDLDVYQDTYISEDQIINQVTKKTLRNLHEYVQKYTNNILPLIQKFATLKQGNEEFQKNQSLFSNQNYISGQQPNLNSYNSKNNQKVFGLTNNQQQDCKILQFLEVEASQINEKLIYQLKQEASIIQSEPCHAIAINNDIQILAASCGKTIKIFEFRAGFLKLVQILAEHTNYVFCLSFMKLSNQLISCGSNQIILWSLNQSNIWEFQQKLEGHVSFIRCVLINRTDDLIISGSDDTTIKFWYKQYQWSNQQTINDHSKRVLALGMNDQQNKLISSSEDNSILIIEHSEQDRKWIVKQKIVVEKYGLRLCFISNEMFAYQPNNSQQMHIYEITNENVLKKSEINQKNSQDIYSLCPQQYIKSKSLLFNKNGFYIHIIRQKENNEFIVEQSINFGVQNLYGVASDDGQYLITWDSQSKAIQVRTNMEK
ncbi:unnamed protein product [Paramecium octaurelia]|uniref:WD domain, G-beta repeat protein n=1 Tax=Paramecium octaurelia TaxID=43137 RepID=A0A8S1UEC5_PAROT|nr:unnamed protein product [Paramecium octaurelia]